MIQVPAKTFDDFLDAVDGLEGRFEWTNGELIAVPPESDENVIIARILDRALSEIAGFQRVRAHQLTLEMPGQPKTRFPDLTVLQPEHLGQLRASGNSRVVSPSFVDWSLTATEMLMV